MLYGLKPTPHAEVVKEKGVDHITVQELVAEITPQGRGQFQLLIIFKRAMFPSTLPSRYNVSDACLAACLLQHVSDMFSMLTVCITALVPDSVKKDLLQNIRAFLAAQDPK